MQFLMIISHDDQFRPTDSLIEGIHAWIVDMEKKGVRVHGNPLRPASDAVTVRIRNGEEKILPGPSTDTKEQMCGYELIECQDLEDAIRLASQHPMAEAATIEVRPIWAQLAK
jgi:hypothetical protein